MAPRAQPSSECSPFFRDAQDPRNRPTCVNREHRGPAAAQLNFARAPGGGASTPSILPYNCRA